MNQSLADSLINLLERGPEVQIGPPAPVIPNCSICNDIGYVYADAKGEQHKPCVCKLAEWEAEQPQRMQRYWDLYTGIPRHWRGRRLQTHPNLTSSANPGLLQRLLSADYAHDSWMFYGPNSRGKTGAAAGYAWEYFQATGGTVWFRTVPDVLTDIKATYNVDLRPQDTDSTAPPVMAEWAVLHRLKSVGLLILDDLGAEYLTAARDPANTWAADRLYQVLNARLGDELPTLFTANITIEELRARVGPRISERVWEMAANGRNVVELTGKNLRRADGL